MARYLFWKVKVVHSLAITGLLVLVSLQARPQSAHSPAVVKKITITGVPIPFREMIDQLTKITGLHFIYSADRINTEKLVSVFAHDKPLDEVLASLGREMNVTFKRQDKYIVIKAAPVRKSVFAPISVMETRKWEVNQKIQDPENNFAYTDPNVDRPALYPSIEASKPAFTNSYFKDYAKQLRVYFDTSLLKNIAVSDLRKLNTRNRHPGWFASAGLVLNDYSAGAELQVGIRSLYLVYSPGWLKGGQFHGAYGLGTSFLLSRNFSINEIYTYAVVKQDKSTPFSSPKGTVREIRNELSARHHQVKVLLQYSATSHITFRLGSSLNYLNTTYTIAPPMFNVYHHIEGMVGTVGPDGNFATPSGMNTNPLATNQRYRTAGVFRGTSESSRMWFGWEAGVSYKINFFPRH